MRESRYGEDQIIGSCESRRPGRGRLPSARDQHDDLLQMEGAYDGWRCRSGPAEAREDENRSLTSHLAEPVLEAAVLKDLPAWPEVVLCER